jgi:hypothetical protein
VPPTGAKTGMVDSLPHPHRSPELPTQATGSPGVLLIVVSAQDKPRDAFLCRRLGLEPFEFMHSTASTPGGSTSSRPLPGTGEVLVAVKAAGVGPWDGLVREGRSRLGQRR